LSRKTRPMEEGSKAPVWVITFSDMITLLLTFFVLLVSLGHIRDETLFDQGQRLSTYSFLQGIKVGFGIRKTPDFGNIKIKYAISTPDKLLQVRTIDAKEEELRRIFQKVNRSMTTMPSQIVTKRTFFSVTGIRFSPGEVTLEKEAKGFLTEFCLGLQQNLDSKSGMGFRSAGTLYVLGLAGEQVTEKQQWILSARRAQAVAEFLQATLCPQAEPHTQYGVFEPLPKWRIYWWGAGSGGAWVEQDSPVSMLTQILIAVLWPSD